MTERPVRFEIERPVDFRLTDVRSPLRLHGRTVNLSSGGALIRTEQMIDVGRKVDMIVRMSKPSAEASDPDLRLLGVIIRSGPGWMAVRIRKHQFVPMNLPGTHPGMDNTAGIPDGL